MYFFYVLDICAKEKSHYIDWAFTVNAVRVYVENNGTWPTSWSDLEKLKMDWLHEEGWSKSFDEESWSRFIARAKSRVVVDFDADICAIARQSWEEFNAIRPAQGNSLCESPAWKPNHVIPLLQAARRAVSQQNNPTSAPSFHGGHLDFKRGNLR
jgi:hypothetical protein